MAVLAATIRPNGTIAVSDWTTPSASHHLATGDASDATYSERSGSATSSHKLEMTLGTYVIPAGQAIYGLAIGARYRWQAPTHATLSQIYYLYGVLPGANPTNMPVVTVSWVPATSVANTIYERVGAVQQYKPGNGLTGGPSAGGPWTQADLDALQAQIQDTSHYVGIGAFQLLEYFVQVWTVAAPVVTVSAPTGVQTTGTPTAVWAYSQADGAAQQQYRHKVFTQAQVDAVGFNTETTTPVYDSGDVLGDALTDVVTVPLLTGTTYRSLVKASDGTRWSPWAQSPQFTVASGSGLFLDSPAVPSIASVVGDPTLNRVAVAVQGHDNEATRAISSMEENAALNLFDADGTNVTLARDVVQFSHATASLKLTSTGAGGTVRAIAWKVAPRMPIIGGKVYRVFADSKAGTTGRVWSVGLRYYDAGGSVIGADVKATAAANNNATWSSLATGGGTLAAAPANAAYAALFVEVAATVAGEIHYFDRIGFAPAAPYANQGWTKGGILHDFMAMADTFNRADAAIGNVETPPTGMGPLAWAAEVGTWTIASNKVYVSTVTADARAVAMSRSLHNGYVEADLVLSPTAQRVNVGLIVHAKGASTEVLTVRAVISATQNVLELIKTTGAGAVTVLQSVSAQLVGGQTYRLRVEFFGGVIRAYLDGFRWIDYTLSAADLTTYGGNDRYGLYMSRGAALDDGLSRIDNFLASQAPSQQVFLQRSEDAGVTWEDVRSAFGVDLPDPGQLGTVYDYEAPRGLPVVYRARVRGQESDTYTWSGYSATSGSATLLGDGFTWLKSPTDPALSQIIHHATVRFESESSEDMEVYRPEGRREPVVVSGTIQAEVMSLDLAFRTDAAWRAFEVLRARQEPLLFQTCYGDADQEQYWVRLGPTRKVTRVTHDTMADGQLRLVTVGAIEVAQPVVV